MDIFQALILGIVQGITEWLPISSSGHLVLFQQFFNMDASVAFDVLLHVATLIVIFIVFWKDITAIFKSLISIRWDDNTKLFLFIILASIPTAIIGLLFQDWLKGLFTNMLLLGVFFIINGIILFLTKFAKEKQGKELNWLDSILMGIAQGLSIIPSISRSGATVSTGLFLGLKKEKLITFSFLIAIPAIIGAFVMESGNLSFENPLTLIIGSLASLVVGYFSLKFIIKIIEKGKWHYFAYYCVLLGIIIIILR
jgi:undecaprenyl-diphosphatase